VDRPAVPPLDQEGPPATRVAIRWRLTSDDEVGSLFSDDDIVERHRGVGEYRSMEFLHVNARRLINRVPPQSVVPFRYTINAYRGCSHACTYCFARPTHEYLGLGMGEDFERRIVVKVNAIERVEAELRSPRWRGDHIAMGTNTDPYQKAEAKYHLTRGIVEALGRHANPFSILTKSTLVLRDLDVLLAAAERTEVRLAFSIGTLDRDVWRLTEPGTPPPEKRVEAVRKLNDAGIPCSVLVAPLLPGLSDRHDQIEAVAKACVAAGAVSITPIALHLRPGVREHYLAWLEQARPELVSLHERRFGRRSYQPDVEQRRIRDIVDAALGKEPAQELTAGSMRTWRSKRFTTGHERPDGDAPAPRDRAAATTTGRGPDEVPEETAQAQLRLF
jgi:DNA repair photolyase